jgi:hypothetical protein
VLYCQGQYSGINSFLTPPVAFKDCVHSDDLRAEDQHHHRDCFKHIAPVKMLLAADHGQNSMGDGSWLTDGAGFTTLNQFASAPSNLLGPLWPGKLYNLPGAPAETPPVPIGNLIYSALTATGAAIWGMQVRYHSVIEQAVQLTQSALECAHTAASTCECHLTLNSQPLHSTSPTECN